MSRANLTPVMERVMSVLGDGEWHKLDSIAAALDISRDAVGNAYEALRRRGFRIEADKPSRTSKGIQLQPWPRIKWLPVAYVVDYWRMTEIQHFTPAEARRMIEDVMAVDARRSGKLAA